jgi:preprotein translocase subunit SecF
MEIIKHRKIYFTVSALLVAASVIVIFAFGFNLGIDFTGGALMEIQLDERVEVSASDIEHNRRTRRSRARIKASITRISKNSANRGPWIYIAI